MSCGKCEKNKNIQAVFQPKSIAVVGASSNPSKIGHLILKNIVECGYEGAIYPIHPKEEEILGKKAYPSVKDIPGNLDFGVISIPAPHVAQTLEECGKKGVGGVVVITSGFGEVGNMAEEQELIDIAHKYNIALIGPNTLGVVYTPSKINASFGPQNILPGKIAFISQSGALAIALMGWTVMEKIGLTSLVSLGNKADVEEKALIEYFNDDPNVDVIVIYMEGLKDGRKFLETKITKPVVILKVGRSQRGAKAAASHTGSLSGSDKIYEAAFKQIGILRAKNFTDAFVWSRALSLPVPDGDEAVIITNGGGIGVAATDECEEAGIPLLEDPKWLEERFRKTMPDFGSTKNPIDITGGGHGAQYRQATQIALSENKIKSAVILYCETAVTNPMEIAQAIAEEYNNVKRNKPLVVAMVGGERSRAALHFLNEQHIPAYSSVTEAISGLRVLYDWRDFICREKDSVDATPAPDAVVAYLDEIRKQDRNILLEHEARTVLEMCGVPTPPWGFAKNIDEAVEKAHSIYPLAMKIASPDIIHKTDVGGVVLNISNEEELREQYNKMMTRVKQEMPDADIHGVNLITMMTGIECIVGLSQDKQFGPVVMFGLGGVFVEALKDVAFRIVPFGAIEAERLLGDIQARKILDGFRGIKAHRQSIIQTLCAIQKLAPLVQEIDINPLITNQNGSFAVDARIII